MASPVSQSRLDEISITHPRASFRLKRLVAQLAAPVPSGQSVPDSKLLLEQHQALQDLRVDFDISAAKLRQLSAAMVNEMFAGLEPRAPDAPVRIKMLPAFVERRALGAELSGNFLALDLGGTNLRVMRVELDRGRIANRAELSDPRHVLRAVIPEEHRLGTAQGLFGFIAAQVAEFVLRREKIPAGAAPLPLGFTFSFPVLQEALDSGVLTNWTKGFSAAGVVGQDIVLLLQEALEAQPGLRGRVAVRALCNDTVGTLVARFFEDRRAEIGMILGTGSNACYWERRIPKLAGRGPEAAPMCVNMEWGNFNGPLEPGARPPALPLTRFDDHLDARSIHPGLQRYEKMISGMYIWELARLVLNDLHARGLFFRQQQGSQQDGKELFRGPWSSGSKFQPLLLDTSRLLTPTGRVLRDLLAAEQTSSSEQASSGEQEQPEFSLSDREIAREVCQLVVRRAARLVSAGVHAVLCKAGAGPGAVVAVDGGVYQHTPGFPQLIAEGLRELDPEAGVQLQLQQDGSGIGAALIAALALQK